ncbi:50S ribosomal protein L29 [bacterium]|nr:50S ribosomal protein L29 [bacterium]
MKRKEQLKKYLKMSLVSLIKEEGKLRKKIFDTKTKLVLGKLKNTAQISILRKELARLKTIIRQKAEEEVKEKKKKAKKATK